MREVDNDRGCEAGRRRGGAGSEAGGGRDMRLVSIDRVRSQAGTGCIEMYYDYKQYLGDCPTKYAQRP